MGSNMQWKWYLHKATVLSQCFSGDIVRCQFGRHRPTLCSRKRAQPPVDSSVSAFTFFRLFRERLVTCVPPLPELPGVQPAHTGVHRAHPAEQADGRRQVGGALLPPLPM